MKHVWLLLTAALLAFVLSLSAQTSREASRAQFSAAIDQIDVVVIRRPQGDKVAATRLTGGQAFSGQFPQGQYVIVMSWPVRVLPNAKSFFESRSNVSNIAAPGWQLVPETDQEFAPEDWAQFERWPYAFVITGQGVKKGQGYIEEKEGRIELVHAFRVEPPNGATVRAVVRRANVPEAGTAAKQPDWRNTPVGGFTNPPMGGEQPRYSVGIPNEQPALSAKEIDGIDIIIKKKPSGTRVGHFRLSNGEPLSASFPAGEYVLIMSWESPVRSTTADGAQLKSFFESRSNVSNIAAPGWQVTAGADAGFAPTEWLQFERWPYAYAISGQGVKRGAGFIEYQAGRVYLVQEIVVPADTQVRANVKKASKAPPATINPNQTEAVRPVN